MTKQTKTEQIVDEAETPTVENNNLTPDEVDIAEYKIYDHAVKANGIYYNAGDKVPVK